MVMKITPSTRLLTIGSADAFNHCGKANSCFWVEDDIGKYLLDCGPTTPMALQQLKLSSQLDLTQLDTIYLTHLHGDHIGGLPVLLLELNFSLQRQLPLTIAGPIHTEERVRALCESSYPTILSQIINFTINFVEWPLTSTNQIGGRTISSIPALHDVNAFATSINIQSEHTSITFSGDTGWNDALIPLSHHVDALVIECSYEKAVFSGHIGLDEITQHRDQLKPKLLILTHFSEGSRKAASRKQANLNLQIADDGVEWFL